jgi:hypothetical protein
VAKALYYSPRLDRSLISPLYRAAKAQRIPMTTLASRFVSDGLTRMAKETKSVIAEEPPKRQTAPAE